MKISIITLFPDMFSGPFDHSIIKHAKEKGLVEIEYINIRDFGIGKHKLIDDTPYGGGHGMVMRVDVLHRAILKIKNQKSKVENREKIILLSASGKQFTQTKAKEFSKVDHLILVCGHYEGVDERIKQYIDEEISIGDFVVTGGELPAMLIADAVTRLIPNVLKAGVTDHESFSYEVEGKNHLEYPHYTKPQEYEGQSVPDVLLSGNHKQIEEWKKGQAIRKTKETRPDM